MKKMMLIIATMLFAFGCSTSDDNTPPVKPETKIPVSEYKTAILKSWNWEKKQFLDKNGNVIKEFDYKLNKDCPLEKWTFEEETLTMFEYVTDGMEKCREVGTAMKYSVHEGKLHFFYPSDGSFIQNTFNFLIFEKDTFTIREDYEYSEEEAVGYNYPKETKYIQFIFKR